jgi:phosphoribosylglycinamide formyltransferase-1
MSNFHLAILASGSGSTGEPLFDKADLLITNNEKAPVKERASEHKLDCIVLPKRDYLVYKENGEIDQEATRLKYGQSLLATFRIYDINYISQNGWSVMTPVNVIKQFNGKIINSHPAPLDPGFEDFGGVGMHGLAVHAAVLIFKKRINRPFDYTEVCLHQVTEEYDKGMVVAASLVKIEPNDTPESLQQRVKEVERQQNKAFWDHVEKTGEINPIYRTQRLILPGEEYHLAEAKRLAIAQYPKG